MTVLSALLALALAAEPSGAAAPGPAALAIGDRAVQVPAGCESSAYPGGARITCAANDWVAWGRSDDAEAAEARSALGAVLRAPVLKPGWSSTEADVACRVGGVEATCTRVLGASSGERLLILWATSRDGRGVTIASCMAPGAKPGRACALVFELPGAP